MAALGHRASDTADQQRYWVFRIARNLLVDYYRRGAQHATAAAPLNEDALTSPGSANARSDMDTALAVDAAVARLPEELRVVLTLSVLGGLTSGEIGEALGRPPGTVRYQLAEARRCLALEMGLGADAPIPARDRRAR